MRKTDGSVCCSFDTSTFDFFGLFTPCAVVTLLIVFVNSICSVIRYRRGQRLD